MTETDHSHTAVLLPPARIAVFSRDKETHAAFEGLTADWRFARVTVSVEEGDVETATTLYETQESPDLVIVQTDTIDSGFTDQLEGLAARCAEGTAAVVIGPVNDVNLYRQLIAMGVSDYLVRPLATETLSHDIASTLLEKFGAAESRLIVVMGSKGGVGTTVLTEALAWGLSDDLGQKTFLMDAAGGWSTLSVGMNFEPSTTLAEAVKAATEGNEDALTRMMHEASEKLSVLSSGGDVMLDDPVDGGPYEALLDHLLAVWPIVLLDLSGSAAPALKRIALTRAHEILLVTTPTLPAVRATRTLMQEIRELRGGEKDGVDVILNMEKFFPKHEVAKAHVEEGLECKIGAMIPYDPELFITTEGRGKKLSSAKGGAGITKALLPLARKVLTGVHLPEDHAGGGGQDMFGGLLSKLTTKQG